MVKRVQGPIEYDYSPDEFTRPDSLYALVQRSLRAIAAAEGGDG